MGILKEKLPVIYQDLNQSIQTYDQTIMRYRNTHQDPHIFVNTLHDSSEQILKDLRIVKATLNDPESQQLTQKIIEDMTAEFDETLMNIEVERPINREPNDPLPYNAIIAPPYGAFLEQITPLIDPLHPHSEFSIRSAN